MYDVEIFKPKYILPLIYYFLVKGDNWDTDLKNKAFINELPPFNVLFLCKGR